jgi:hypothetical protein
VPGLRNPPGRTVINEGRLGVTSRAVARSTRMVWSNCGAPDGQCGSLHQDTAIGNVAVIGNIRGQENTHGGAEIVVEP